MTDKKQIIKALTEKAGVSNSISGRFIFDAADVVNPVVFSCHKVGNEFGYGLMIPKEIPVFAGRGKEKKIVGSQQVKSPAVVTSGHELIEPTMATEKTHKIKYIAVPTDLTLRWEVEEIKKFLDGKTEKVNGKEIFKSICKMEKFAGRY